MIINPSAHTMIPRRNSFRRHDGYGRRQSMTLPGGKQLWYGLTKVLLVAVLFLCVAFSLMDGSRERIAAEIADLEAVHNELVTTNILLRAKKARVFSSEAVGVAAGSQLAIHTPVSEQYLEF